MAAKAYAENRRGASRRAAWPTFIMRDGALRDGVMLRRVRCGVLTTYFSVVAERGELQMGKVPAVAVRKQGHQ